MKITKFVHLPGKIFSLFHLLKSGVFAVFHYNFPQPLVINDTFFHSMANMTIV